ncbi:hypothetical protein RO3G_02662 [Lichtheimia corymbifera JMRC:FSU:9682]|uniref:UBX domain-containing protein n=1 Tax=Lichtheimia corymbifera JMRC:FSU:9682 TaxID=1263082 RepID=A0A068SC93_9FUNG|nr:hypothetical protein RO3G_02662 [Lichtheimia corymbifera JMRC:FSU:9682]
MESPAPASQDSTPPPPPEPPVFDRQIKMIRPPANAPAIVELPESFYKLSPNEVKSLYQSHVERRENLENRPLKTQKIRVAEEQERMKKYPKTTIRVRFPDSTMLQATFKSSERVRDLYDFVQSTLETPSRKFLLCLPPRSKLIEPELTLYKAGLAPASNVTFVWIEKAAPGQRDVPAVTQSYLSMMEDLPPPSVPSPVSSPGTASTASNSSASASTKKAGSMPKWLQKGLFKK